ncbi:hypothetical protein NDU88_005931 [Pleurodeles waltl]|uniref:Uncharacterized protein n=1 Tax=Pleurodeles waltl TaxID=8319 RepID=A0AAV7NQD2_PLEWA|nr:hypothetical protein NDU88_005931 [Pleurodeles waltl]
MRYAPVSGGNPRCDGCRDEGGGSGRVWCLVPVAVAFTVLFQGIVNVVFVYQRPLWQDCWERTKRTSGWLTSPDLLRYVERKMDAQLPRDFGGGTSRTSRTSRGGCS